MEYSRGPEQELKRPVWMHNVDDGMYYIYAKRHEKETIGRTWDLVDVDR